jgi:hypothetical protein
MPLLARKEAEEVFYTLLPFLRYGSWNGIRTIALDSLFQWAEWHGATVRLHRILTLLGEPQAEGLWEFFSEYIPPEKITNAMFSVDFDYPLEGDAILLPDRSWDSGVETMPAETVRECLSDSDNADAYEGDLIILWRQMRVVTVLHHGGVFAHINCNEIRTPKEGALVQ